MSFPLLSLFKDAQPKTSLPDIRDKAICDLRHRGNIAWQFLTRHPILQDGSHRADGYRVQDQQQAIPGPQQQKAHSHNCRCFQCKNHRFPLFMDSIHRSFVHIVMCHTFLIEEGETPPFGSGSARGFPLATSSASGWRRVSRVR